MERLSLATTTQRWLFLAFFIAFAVKVPIFPLHTWLPDAHTEAPTNGSIVLAALLLKAGPYGLLRFNLDLFPEASRYFAQAIGILAVVGIVYGALVAMMQTDVKRLVAYSSVSHMGFVILGIFTFTMQGTSGAVMQMVNHGLSTGLLFFVIGVLYERTHTRDLSEMGGLATVTPWIAAAFLVATLSSIGLPGLNNFVGEFLVILGSFGADRILGAVAVSGVVLAAIYMLWAYQRAFQGPGAERHRGLVDLLPRELAAVVPGRRRDAGARRRAEPGPGPDQPVLGRGGGVGAERRRRPAGPPGRPAGEAAAAGRGGRLGDRRRRGRRRSLMPTPAIELGPVMPELILVGVAVVLLLAGVVARKISPTTLLLFCLVGIAAAAVAAVAALGLGRRPHGPGRVDLDRSVRGGRAR